MILTLFYAAVLLLVSKGFIEPLAVKIWDRLVIPNMSGTFEKINPHMSEWLANKTADQLEDSIVEALGSSIENWDDYREPLKDYAVKRIRELYDPVINAQKIEKIASIASLGKKLLK